MRLTIDLSALGAEVQRIAAATVARIVDASDDEVRAVADREIARLERGTPAERAVARGLRVTIGHSTDEAA